MTDHIVQRDDDGIAHIVALSGGDDSTAMAMWLKEHEPRPYMYICTPTGDELPEMFKHWRRLGAILGERILPIMNGTLDSVCESEKALPNIHMRFCTRLLKIVPYQMFITMAIPAVSYVGLRADEDIRDGVNYAGRGGNAKLREPDMISVRYPLRELGWGESDVQHYNISRGVFVPERTDCARCPYQSLPEWWRLWYEHPDIYADAESQEQRFGHTFRSPGRDTWPAALSELRAEFESGRVPRNNPRQRDLFKAARCRACTL